MFTVSLELFEHVRSFFGVGYMLRCRLRVLTYNNAAATRYIEQHTVEQHAACRIGPTGKIK